ncbi:MAG: hypothetical protein AAF959_14220 [Cyanobacteria bacterium P01_D01_bin.56]
MATQQHTLIKHILAELPLEQRYTFSNQQIEALHQAALTLPKAKHAINLRVSVPFPGKGFYMVFFAGQERRSRRRLLADRDFQLFPKILVLLMILLGCAKLVGLAHGQRMLAISEQREAVNFNDSSEMIHPTVVPFKQTREECETSGRDWKDGQCFDYGHSHTF